MLSRKIKHLISVYERVRLEPKSADKETIKWDAELDRYCRAGINKEFKDQSIVRALYRPFTRRWLYFDAHLNGRTYQLPSMFPPGTSNKVISFSDTGYRSEFCVLSANGPVDLHFGASVDAYQIVSRYRYGSNGHRVDNITDWALEQFRTHYENGGKSKRPITKDAIFDYVYAVLHDPMFRQKYAQNLKREFPRIPFYPDFWRWVDWGKALMALHVGYETVEPWGLKRIDAVDEKSHKAGLTPKAALRAYKDAGTIQIDTETQITGIPAQAWKYHLGNRSALEWVLDQSKERTPKDPTIRENFNSYRFADCKEKVIELLSRVTRVSVETQKIILEMSHAKREPRARDRSTEATSDAKQHPLG
jgi:predicted helicase